MPSDIDGSRDKTAYATRVTKAAALRVQNPGMTWEEIAAETGYGSKGSACAAVLKHVREQREETITQLRDLTNARYEWLMGKVYAKASEGDLAAVEAYRKLLADFRRHNGLDAPMQVQISSGAENRLQDVLADATTLVMGMVQDDGTHVVTDLPEALEA